MERKHPEDVSYNYYAPALTIDRYPGYVVIDAIAFHLCLLQIRVQKMM